MIDEKKTDTIKKNYMLTYIKIKNTKKNYFRQRGLDNEVLLRQNH